jgi:hypothetical protein
METSRVDYDWTKSYTKWADTINLDQNDDVADPSHSDENLSSTNACPEYGQGYMGYQAEAHKHDHKDERLVVNEIGP